MSTEQKQHRSLESYTEKEKWDSMSNGRRAQYIWDYYKLPIVIICVIVYMLSYTVYRHVTHKDTVLYTALVNVGLGGVLEGQITTGFLDDQGINSGKNQLMLYSGWYLTDDSSSEYHEYTYATRLKILAAIDGEQLDVVLMNREAFDAFAQNGYLYNLEELLPEISPELYDEIEDYIITNMEILEDNSQDLMFDPNLEYISETTEYPMAVDLSEAAMIKDAGFGDSVYFGILGNSPRTEMAVEYLGYLFS